MNVSNLETIEQIREFLKGTADVAFSNPTDASALRTFVAAALRRYRYFRLSKGPRGVLFAYAALDQLFTATSVPVDNTIS